MIYLMKSVPNRIRNLSKDEPISEAARSLASPERHLYLRNQFSFTEQFVKKFMNVS